MSDTGSRQPFQRYQPPPLEQLEEPSSQETKAACLQPRVMLQRDGDRVKQIDIVCPCGNTIQVECDYDAS